MTHEEKLQLFRTVVQVVNGRIPVIAGTGSNSTQASIELTKEAEKIGVDMVMLVAPYYNKPSQEGLYQHFKAIATSTHLPVMLYNIPGRSSVKIALKCTNTSLPSSTSMNPKPFSALNHLTFPVCMKKTPFIASRSM